MNSTQVLEFCALLGVEVPTHTHGQNILVHCPGAAVLGGHSGTTSSRRCFSVLVNDFGPSVCHCFACGKLSGKAVWVAERLNKASGGQFAEAVAFAKKHDGADLGRSMTALRKRVRTPQQMRGSSGSKTYQIFCETAGQCPRYILSRGITLKEVKKYQIGFDKKLKRATFPIYDVESNLVGITGRAIYEGAFAKYKMYEGFDAKRYFYGENHLDTTRQSCVLVEGPIDAIVVSRLYPNVLALLGLNLSRQRIVKLKSWFNEAVLLLDPDEAGFEAARRFAADIRGVIRLYAAWLPEGVDPKKATTSQLAVAFKNKKLMGLSL